MGRGIIIQEEWNWGEFLFILSYSYDNIFLNRKHSLSHLSHQLLDAGSLGRFYEQDTKQTSSFLPVRLSKGKPQTQQQRSQQKMALQQEYQHGHLRSTENHQSGESEFSKGKLPEKGAGNFLMSHPRAYTFSARLCTTTFAAVGNGESYWTTCMKTRKKKKTSGRAIGQKQARKMSTRQNDATSIKMMLLSMTALGRWWCW